MQKIDSMFASWDNQADTKISSGFKIPDEFYKIAQRKTSYPSNEVIDGAIREAKYRMFLHSAKHTTAEAKAKKLFEPETKIMIVQDSKRFNHVHARKVKVYSQI